jgi:hypothetical protein
MPRARYIKPEFFKDEDLSRLSLAARLLFVGLWSMADRDGRLEDRPLRIKAELFPYEGVDVDPLLAELAATKAHGLGSFILRYEVSGRRYIQIVNFSKHQKCHPGEKGMNFPEPPAVKHVSPENKTANPPLSGDSVLRMVTLADSVPEPAPSFEAPSKLTFEQRIEYGRQVWEAWVKRRGRGGPEMSSAEWSDVILSLMNADVPLRVALQGIADCRGKLDPQKSLLYAKPAIAAEVQRWQRGRTA